MHLIGIFTPAMTTWDYIKDRWSYINKTMQPCYAITSSHLGLCREREKGLSAQLHQAASSSSATSTRPYLIVRTLLRLCSDGGEVASFLKHIQTKEETGCVFFAAYCCLCFCPTGWTAITADFLSSAEPGRAEAALTSQYPEGRDGSCQNSHLSPCSRGDRSSSCCPTGLCCTLPLISSISSLEGTGLKWM